MTEGMDDLSPPPGGATSPTGSPVDTGQVPKEKPEEIEAAAESEEGGAAAEGGGEGGDDGGDGEHLGALGIVALPGTCCVCVEMEQIHNCLHSEKICLLPIVACLLSLALCVAGLKWVFVDKIFEYETPTHLDPKPIGQDPVVISVDPASGFTVTVPRSSPSTLSLTSAFTPGRPEVLVEDMSTRGPFLPPTPAVTRPDPSVTLKYNAERTPVPKPRPRSTQETNDIVVPTTTPASTSTTTRSSSHVTRCSHSQRNYCVNGGECFTLEITPGSTKFLCRCPNEFTGDRCQNYVMASFYKAEELYQKRILTISGICIALLVVGIMCVVAYCKTKKQRKKLHDRMRQSLRKKRNNNNNSTNSGVNPKPPTSTRGRRTSNLPLQDLQLNNPCNGTPSQLVAEETTFSTDQYEATTLTQISSQRFVSLVTSPVTPASPPSEVSAPLSSLAMSVPSVALSPSGEEERPLLLSRQQHKSSGRDQPKRASAHYNYGHMAHSLPPSPLFQQERVDYDAADSARSPDGACADDVSDCSSQSAASDRHLSASDDSLAQEPQGEHLPFMTTGGAAALLLRAADIGRTNPASCHELVHEHMHELMSANNVDPVAV